MENDTTGTQREKEKAKNEKCWNKMFPSVDG